MTGIEKLLADCESQGIRLLLDGNDGLTIDAPQDALTPGLLERLKTNKRELLVILRAKAEATFELVEVESEPYGPDGWPLDSIDLGELEPCSNCGTLELWQTVVGNWRCMRCDPPTTSRRLSEFVERRRREDNQNKLTSMNSICPCGSTRSRDVPISGTQSIRRDCDQCGRFIKFPAWHGSIATLTQPANTTTSPKKPLQGTVDPLQIIPKLDSDSNYMKTNDTKSASTPANADCQQAAGVTVAAN